MCVDFSMCIIFLVYPTHFCVVLNMTTCSRRPNRSSGWYPNLAITSSSVLALDNPRICLLPAASTQM